MRFVSFNINSVRARLHQLQQLIDTLNPDVIGLQETKVFDPDFPLEAIQAMGYQVEIHGQKSHYGVALLSRTPALRIQKGFPWDTEDAQRRFIAAEYEIQGQRITVANGYFPQGESRDHPIKFPAKAKFYADLKRWLQETQSPDKPLIVMGDMNISHKDPDIGIGEQNAKRWLRDGKCSFLPEERVWLNEVTQWGLQDTYRQSYPDANDRFSWFDYRSKGFEDDPRRGLRIDLILATAPLMAQFEGAGIDYDIRGMDKPSDHCPVWADFSNAPEVRD